MTNNRLREYFEWRYQDAEEPIILIAYKPVGQNYPVGHKAEGKPCHFWACTGASIEYAVKAVEEVQKHPHAAIWASVHTASPVASEARKDRWPKWDVSEVQAYQFLELDFDNILPELVIKGSAASDEERGKIEQHVMGVRADLMNRGLPEPLMTSTGNGYLLSFPIDLPNTPEHRQRMKELSACLAVAFDRPFTNLDTGVLTDPSRILGVPGTVNAGKFPNPEQGRVHRIREIIGDYPDRTPMSEAEFIEWADSYIAEARQQHGEAVVVPKITEGMTPRAAREARQRTSGSTSSSPEAMKRALAYVAKVPPAIQGDGGDLHTFRTAGNLLAFGLTPDEVFEAMQEWNETCSPPWDDAGLRAKIDSADQNGTPRPQKNVEKEKPITWGDGRLPFDGGSAPDCLPHTDLGNARRLVHYHGDKLRHVSGIGWHFWTGTHWAQDMTGHAMRAAKDVAERIHFEADHCRRREIETKHLFKWAVASESAGRLDAMLAVASTEPKFVAAPEELDGDRWTFNVQNGTIDLRTGKLRPHEPNDLITKVSPVTFDPDAKCPIFDAFMQKTFPNQPLIDYMLAVLGHCLSGDISLEHLWVLHGGGANGKSTLLGVVQHIMSSYAGNAPESLLMVGRDEHPTELADLQGKRLVIASETESNARLKLQLIKRLTGEPTIKARRMRQDFYEFGRTHKTLMMTNNKPKVSENSEAVWRRLKLIPFSVKIETADRDPHLGEKLRAEASGVLNRLIAGCLDWQHRGLVEPEEVTAATNDYKNESDPLTDWIDEQCVEAKNAFSVTTALYVAYADYCKRGGEHPMDKRSFGQALGKRGYLPVQRNIGRGWLGLTILSKNDTEEVDDDWLKR